LCPEPDPVLLHEADAGEGLERERVARLEDVSDSGAARLQVEAAAQLPERRGERDVGPIEAGPVGSLFRIQFGRLEQQPAGLAEARGRFRRSHIRQLEADLRVLPARR
jgi:hypothetical protein